MRKLKEIVASISHMYGNASDTETPSMEVVSLYVKVSNAFVEEVVDVDNAEQCATTVVSQTILQRIAQRAPFAQTKESPVQKEFSATLVEG